MRCCTVTSCPFVAVLLLTFRVASCEDNRIPEASCSYEVCQALLLLVMFHLCLFLVRVGICWGERTGQLFIAFSCIKEGGDVGGTLFPERCVNRFHCDTSAIRCGNLRRSCRVTELQIPRWSMRRADLTVLHGWADLSCKRPRAAD